MSKASEYLAQKQDSIYKPNFDASGFIQQNQNAMNQWAGGRDQIWQNYQKGGQEYLNGLKQQTQQQMQFLNQQLANNKQKYQLQAQHETGRINQNFEEQNKNIDKMTFEQYKMSNQMGANRGVSASAQQNAMDNQVGQMSAGLFNQNATDRNNSLSDLNNKMMQGMIDLDNQYSQNVMNVLQSEMKAKGEYALKSADAYMQFASQTADKMLETMMRNNEIQFNSQLEMEKYKANLSQKIFEMGFQEASNQDNRDFDWKKLQANFSHDKDMASINFNNQMALAKYNASQRGSGSGSGSSKSETDAMMGDMYQYYINQGHDPLTAEKMAKQDIANARAGAMPSEIRSTKNSGYSTASRSNAISYQTDAQKKAMEKKLADLENDTRYTAKEQAQIEFERKYGKPIKGAMSFGKK